MASGVSWATRSVSDPSRHARGNGPLSRVRRRGRLASAAPDAGVHALRHGIAGAGRCRRSGRRARPRRRAGGACRRAAGLGRAEAQRPLPELSRGVRARCLAAGPALRVLRGSSAPRVHGRGARVPSRQRAAVRRRHRRRARAYPPLVRRAVVRALGFAPQGADRHRARRLPAVLDFRCARRRALDRRGRTLLLRNRNAAPRRPSARGAGAQGALDAGVGHADARLRRRPGLRVGRREAGARARHRAVSHRRPRAVRPGLRRRLGGRALPGRTPGGGAACAGGDAAEAPGGLRRPGSRRHAAQSPGRGRLVRTDVQARAHAGVAPHLRLRPEELPVRDERCHRQDRGRVSEEPVAASLSRAA